ncbi:deoxyhypusine synthase [Candidatus Woesearchaeota archaeon]|nr:deoxyhypusine synthase [Candidatus Woesearchaeota archaeon]
MGESNLPVEDIRLSKGISVKDLVSQLANSGFQAQHLGEAVEIIREAKKENAFTFLSFTSNMAASGLRGIFIDLAKNRKIGAVVTSSGSFDEDIIRSEKPYLQGSFESDDEKLGDEGINRMGNIFVPGDRYEFLETKVSSMLAEIYKTKKELTTSELMAEVGSRLNENSFLYWCSRNSIPVFCPGITDGAFGTQLAFFQQKHSDFKIDVVRDFSKIMDYSFLEKKKCAIILGGGIAKHHTIISNLLGGGFDYAVYINSSSPYHGSLSGATTSEAKSWGKIKAGSKAVTIYGDAAILFPLLIASAEEFL